MAKESKRLGAHPGGYEAQSPIDVGPEPMAGRSLWADAWRRLRRDKTAMICLGIILLYALVAIGGAVYTNMAEGDPKLETFAEMYEGDIKNAAPSWELVRDHGWLYVFGADWQGRSVLLATILGAKVSLTVGLMANLIAVPLGMVLGSLAGFFGRKTDAFIVWVYSTLASIPGIIMLIAIKYAFNDKTFLGLDLSGIHGIYIALGVVSWIGTCRLVRAEVMKVRELDYVLAARAVGRRETVILFRHIMPNVLHLGIIAMSLGFVGAVQSEVFLTFLGLGVEVGTPSWGTMINRARMDIVAGYWWEATAAVVALFGLVLALNLFGDRLRDALDPKLRNV
jgi:peptide/nickel transport system permease protein